MFAVAVGVRRLGVVGRRRFVIGFVIVDAVGGWVVDAAIGRR